MLGPQFWPSNIYATYPKSRTRCRFRNFRITSDSRSNDSGSFRLNFNVLTATSNFSFLKIYDNILYTRQLTRQLGLATFLTIKKNQQIQNFSAKIILPFSAMNCSKISMPNFFAEAELIVVEIPDIQLREIWKFVEIGIDSLILTRFRKLN